jgi:uncharacterized FlgJ-related protein
LASGGFSSTPIGQLEKKIKIKIHKSSPETILSLDKHTKSHTMARRRVKKRTHVGAQNGANPTAKGKPMEKTPKSMVIRIGAGEVGASVSQLVKDVRQVMEPDTAVRLKVR